jgi:glycosyltransferase involved in cell wall biosynthesis
VDALARRLGVAGRPVVFYGGRLDRLKGGLELVRAIERVRRTIPGAVILTVGDALPGFAEEMADLAGRLGIPDALVSAGWLSGSELAAAYALSDVVATPSLCFESFGLVNLEAMAAGRPVVASLWGGPSDVVADGETGFLVNPLQVGTLAERLTRLLADATLRERMGRAGRARVERLFSVDRQIDLTLELYRDMGLDTGTTAA